jgi:beta-phosphoglucomutase-like phosphatase (HAD superfamily)
MVDTIIFDAEGVVFDSQRLWDQGQVEFLRRRAILYDREAIKHLLTGRSLIEGARIMQAIYDFPGDPEELANERLEIMKKLLINNLTFIDGFMSFYHSVKESYKTCIATSLATELLCIVENTLNLSGLFSSNVFSIKDVGGVGKPQPDIFLYAAERLKSPAKSCLVIEDAPLGIEAAKRAGMQCIALTTTYGRNKLMQADLVVDSFEQIEPGKF